MEMLWKKGWEWFKIFRSDLLIVLISLRNPGTPRYIKALLLAALFYGISPVDLIPDAIPVVGWIDDAIIVPAAIGAILKLLPVQVRRESEAKAAFLSAKMPFLFLLAAIFVFLWIIFCIWAIYTLFFK